MTTPIVPSISDEQLAELERFLSFGGSMLRVKSDALIGLIARLRAAEADAKRYRWWRDRAGVIPDGDGYTTWVLANGSEMYDLERKETDEAIDAAMERTP